MESNDQRELAYKITPDQDHKFDLAISLNKYDDAFEIAEQQQNVEKWKKVGDVALLMGIFSLAETCFKKSKDYSSLFLFYSSYGDEEGLKFVLEEAESEGKFNIAFEAAYLLALPNRCLDILLKSKRYAEAAMFARSYCPDELPPIIKDWSELLKQNSLPFIPENIFESVELKDTMQQAREIYENQIKPTLYSQSRAPADELDLQRERWMQDFSEEGHDLT